MTFDYKTILAQIEGQLQAIAIENLPVVLQAIQSYVDKATDRLTQLSVGDFDADYIKARLAEEGDLLKEELLSFEIFGEEITEEARDKTIQTIITTVLAVLAQVITK